MLLALVLLLPMLKMGVWLDECCSVYSATAPDLISMVKGMYGRMDDLHPPLFYILLFFFMKWFGINEIIVRLPSLLCGLVLIPIMYWMGKTIHSRPVGLLAAYFAAVSPFSNYFDCQSRGYALATLLCALAVTCFCKLVGHTETRSNKTLPFIGCALAIAGFCYTEYVGCILLPSLGFAAILIYLRDRFHPTESQKAGATFLVSAGALFTGFLLFTPWLPSLLQQSNYGTVMAKPPLSHWPTVFSFSLLMMIDAIPLILAIPLGQCAAVLMLIYGLCKWKDIRNELPARVRTMPTQYIVLLCVVLFPASVMGYITVFWIGYYRYIYPYSPGGWVLLAILLYQLTARGLNIRIPGFLRRALERRRHLLLPTILGSILVLNCLYLAWFVSRPQSGLRTVAQEAVQGKFDDCAILLAPDVIGPTLKFYLPASDRTARHIVVVGFPRWDDPESPVIITDLPKQWGNPAVVDETASRIAELSKRGYKYLAFTKDSDAQINLLTTKEVPRASRIAALKEILDKRYKLISTNHYPALVEDVTVYLYRLD